MDKKELIEKYNDSYNGLSIETNSHSIMGRIGGARHSDYVEIIYVKSGCIEVVVNSNGYVVEAGGIILIKSQEIYFIEALSQFSEYILIKVNRSEFWKDGLQTVCVRIIDNLFRDEDDLVWIYSNIEISETHIQELISECLYEWEKQGDEFEWVIKANIIKILVWISRHIRKTMSVLSRTGTKSKVISDAVQYIDDNLETVTAAELADCSGVSYGYFLKVFKEEMGVGFGRFIQSRRLAKSQRLLTETQKSITDIALEVGFSTTSHYIKLFKENVGITPNQYRKRK